jgi:predicted TIM-barrel enzyme
MRPTQYLGFAALLLLPDVEDILTHTTGIQGFFGASSIERLAVEGAIAGQTRACKEFRFANAAV